MTANKIGKAILVDLDGDRKMTLCIQEHPEPLHGCTLHCDILNGSTNKRNTKVHESPKKDEPKRTADLLTKKGALAGLVNMILYLESLELVPMADVEYLWRLHYQVKNDSSFFGINHIEAKVHGNWTTNHATCSPSKHLNLNVTAKSGENDEQVKSYVDDASHELLNLDLFQNSSCFENPVQTLHTENHFLQRQRVSFHCEPCNEEGESPKASLIPILLEQSEISSQEELENSCISSSLKPAETPLKGDIPTNYVQTIKNVQKSHKQYHCTECDKFFLRKGTYFAHMRVHLGLPKYQCSICSKTFTTAPGYRTHKLNHKGLKFQCELCGKAFQTPGNLHSHLRIHDQVKRYPCDICGHRSATACNRQSHMRTHTGDTPYQCNICGIRVTRSDGLRKHIKRKHPGTDVGEIARTNVKIS